VFHIQHQCEGLANTLSCLAKGAKSRRTKLEARIDRAGPPGPDTELAARLELARQIEAQADRLARDIRLLTRWLSHDVLALAGPTLVTRQILFDFVVAELQRREPEDARRIRPVRVALQNQRDDLLAFAGVLDEKLAGIAQVHGISAPLVREACVLHHLPSTSTAYWQGWNRLRAKLGGKFHAAFEAVSRTMAETPRSSTLVENLNSRLRTYFTLRRHLGCLPGLAAVLSEPSMLHAQPPCRAQRQKPAGIDDRSKSSALADAAGPRAASAPASLNRGGWPPPHRTTFEPKTRPLRAGGFRAPV
jgi:hypothetical protein